MDCVFGAIPKKSLSDSRLQRLCPLFSPRNVIIFRFIFRYLIHFLLISVYLVRYGMKSFFLHI